MRRKFLSVVLCVCMMLTMAPFAFAKGSDDTSTTNTQEQAPVANSSGSGSGSSTISVKLPNDNTGNLTISTNNAVLDGRGLTYTNGTITVTAANVTIQNLTFGDKAALVVNTTGEFTLTGCTFTPTTTYAKGSNNQTLTSVRTAVTLNVGEAVVTNNTFNGVTNGYYNAIEFGINGDGNNLSHATITGNTFNSAIQNNYFNFYNMTEGATIDIESNHFLLANKGSNAIRISNFRNVSAVTFNVKDNEYSYENASAESIYEGFILLQDYSKTDSQNFSGITININNLTSPSNATQLFYVYDNQDGIITTNQPIVKGDSSIAKFFSARIGDTYYKTLADAYAALPRNVGANSTPTTITVLKDSDGEAIGSDSDKDMNYVIDFNGHTYTVGKPTVGSTGTETQGLRVLKGSTAVFKNGTLKAANYQNMKMPVHTYGDVTFQDFTVDAREDSYASVAYEIDNGSLEMLGNSSILAYSGKTGLYVAFWPRGNYVDGTTVTINTTGKITGKLVYEWDDVADTSKQQAENKAVLKIENGNFAITGIETRFTNSILSNLKVPKIFISGGYFTIDPSTYVVEGKSALPGSYVIGDTTYNYKVDKALPSNVTVVPGATDVTAPPSMNQEDVSKIASSTIDNVSEKANEVASRLDNSKKATTEDMTKHLPASAPTVSPDATITTVVAPRLDIEVQSYDTKSKTLTLDIKAVYDIKATTANNVSSMIELNPDKSNASQVNTVTIEENAGKLDTTGTPVTVKLTLPGSFANEGAQLYVVHTKSTGEKYVHAVTVQEDDNSALYVEFVNDKGFSTFSISAVVAASITTNGDTTYYETLQDAVNAVQNGQTIKLEKNCDETATVSREVNFTLNPNDKTFSGTISAGSRYSLTKTDGQDNTINYTVTYVGGGSSSGTTTSYNVNVNAATNGAVAADKKTASKGTTVTVTASPSKGYVVDAVKVVDKDGKDVAVTEKDGKYVFTMPASAVTVTGSFKAETPAPVTLPFSDVKSGNWFYDAVKYAYEQGLMTGTSATTFAPNGTMNRAMIVTVLYRLEKSPAVTGASKFTDVPAGQWYSDAVAWAAANKIVNGYDETTFGPMNAVTREQMAAILFRYEQVKGLENVTLEENLNRFPDQNKISAYAIPALQWAVGQKIINGNADGTLDPTGTATRAQVAQIFTNLLNQ